MNRINGHLLIGIEPMPGDNPVRLLDTNKLVGIHFLRSFIPVKQFRIETLSFPVLYIHVSYQFPESFLVIVVGSIRFDTGFYMKDRIELFKIHSFFKCPIRRLLAVENQPLLRIHPIAGHSRIGYKGCHSGCLHHCHGVTFCNSIPRYFLFATTGGK